MSYNQTNVAHVKDNVFATTILQATESGPNVKMEKPSINGGKSIIVRWYWVEGHFGTSMEILQSMPW